VTGREDSPRVVVDPAVMGGAPCIRGTRIPVVTVLGMLAGYDFPGSVLPDYPELSPADLRAAVGYAADALDLPAPDLPNPGPSGEALL
jgi:uncharacterized protein (DUF433 family)